MNCLARSATCASVRSRAALLGHLALLALAACGKVEGAAPDAGGPADAAGPAMITLHNAIGNGQTANGALVAYQDGDGPWQVVTGTAGTYGFSVATGRYGLAVVCERTSPSQGIPFNEVFLDYYAASDGAEHVIFSDCMESAPTKVTITR